MFQSLLYLTTMVFEGTNFHAVAHRGLCRMEGLWEAEAWTRLKVVRMMRSKSQKMSE